MNFRNWNAAWGVLAMVAMTGCGSTLDADTANNSCSLDDNTTATSTLNTYGCAVLTRDVSSCESSRTAQGLSGFWLKFSCRVTLTKSGSNVIVSTDGRPDSLSQYFGSSNSCYEAFTFTGKTTNPNVIAAQSISMTVPYSPTVDATPNANSLGTIGVALNGVSLYNNAAAPGDSIYNEVATFDKCDGHPTNSGAYHYHSEPSSISNSDAAFVGVMRDGYPVYGREDADGSTPTLDAQGGHTGTTVDSGGASIYHYHINLQTSGSNSAYFISTGYYHGNIGTCSGC